MADTNKHTERVRRDIAEFFSNRALSDEFTASDKPFLLVLDEIGTLDQDGGKTPALIDEVITHLEQEYGIKVKVVCSSRDPAERTAEKSHWQEEGGLLRKHAFSKDFWHIRTEEAATRQAQAWLEGGEVSGVLRYQDNLPEQGTPKGVETLLRSQYKDADLTSKLLGSISIKTGLAKPPRNIKSGQEIARKPDNSLKDTLGSKAVGLGQLMHIASKHPELGIKVPEFSVISTRYCQHELGLERVEITGENLTAEWQEHTKSLADDGKLRSVRSGAKNSMPGMMHTVLNVGMTTRRIEQELKNSPEAGLKALQQYSVLLESYQKAVAETSPQKAALLDDLRGTVAGILKDVNDKKPLNNEDLEDIRAANTVVVDGKKTFHFPDDAQGQYISATRAVHASWASPTAQRYCKANDIPHQAGTAVIYQEMAEPVLAGVINSHNTDTGEKGLHGHFGEKDSVVSGKADRIDVAVFAEQYPEKYAQLQKQLDVLFEEVGKPVEVEVSLVKDPETGEPDWRFLQMRDSSLTKEAQLYRRGQALDAAVAQNDVDGIESALIHINELASQIPQTRLAPINVKPDGRGDIITSQAVAGKTVTPPKGDDISSKEAFDLTYQEIQELRAAGHTPILVLDATDYPRFDTLMRLRDGAQAAILLDCNTSSHAAVAVRSSGKGCIAAPKDAEGTPLTIAQLTGREITISESGEIYDGLQVVVKKENDIVGHAKKITQTHPLLDEDMRNSLDALNNNGAIDLLSPTNRKEEENEKPVNPVSPETLGL